jgi:hypothetical protein
MSLLRSGAVSYDERPTLIGGGFVRPSVTHVGSGLSHSDVGPKRDVFDCHSFDPNNECHPLLWTVRDGALNRVWRQGSGAQGRSCAETVGAAPDNARATNMKHSIQSCMNIYLHVPSVPGRA